MTQITFDARLRTVTAGLVTGAVAACLGLGILAVAVILLWIGSPFLGGTPTGALRVAADLWFLAHGADLVRPPTATAAAAPVGMTPLLLAALPAWLLYRAGAHAAMSREGDHQAPETVVGYLVAGYFLVAIGALVFAAPSPLGVRPLGTLLRIPVVAVLAAGAGITKYGHKRWAQALLARAGQPLDALRRSLSRGRADVALRAAWCGVLTLLAGGALLTGGSLLMHLPQARAGFIALTSAPWERCAVLALAATLVPNAAVWGAAYALGPGFAVGAGTAVSPGAARYLGLPDFPLFAALPARGGGVATTWPAVLVPVAAGVVTGLVVARHLAGEPRGLRGAGQTVLVAGCASLGVGLAMAFLAAVASGPVGSGRLSTFGPAWPQTGAAALAWTAWLSAPVALLARWWLGRRRRLVARPGGGGGEAGSAAQPLVSRSGRNSAGSSLPQESRDTCVSASSTQV